MSRHADPSDKRPASEYVDEGLVAGERVLYRTRLHFWATAGQALIVFVAGSLGALILFLIGAPVMLSLVLFGVAALIEMAGYLTYATSEFALTNRRVLAKVGWIQRHSIEILLGKIESIAVDQDALGRLLGYGTVVVIGTGGTRERLAGIAAPLEFRSRVQAEISATAERTRIPGS